MIDENLRRNAKLHQSFTRQSRLPKSDSPHSPASPIRLSILTQYYPPDYAATGQLIEELAINLSRQGMKVHVFTGQPGYAYGQTFALPQEESQGVKIRRSRTTRVLSQRIRGKAINGLLFCIRAGLHLLKTGGRGDILMLTTAPPFLPLLGYLANVCFGLPYVCLLYDLYPDVAVELQVVSAKHPIVKLWDWINAQVWKKAQAIIVLSSTMKMRVEAKCPEVADKISVVHSWANPNQIVPIDKEHNWFAHRYNLVERFSVLYSGNMGRCHDMETILATAAHLQNEPIQFVFIGNGAKRQACMEQVEALGLKNCLFLPYQDKECLPYSLTSGDLSLVSISPGMEGIVAPSKFYGILAAGSPVAVICEPHSYLRELVKNAECGKAFNNGDSVGLAEFIRQLARDRQLSQMMGHAGRQYLQFNFTPEIIAQEYRKILQYSAQGKTPFPSQSLSTTANGSRQFLLDPPES